MQFITSVTPKGKITLPKILRIIFGVKKHDKVFIEAEKDYIKIPPIQDIISLAGKF